VNISEFRSIADQQFAAVGLVVLFGPNTAGKSSVLEAAEQLITRAEIRRADLCRPGGGLCRAVGLLRPPGADVSSSADAETYRRIRKGAVRCSTPCGLIGL
jgi:hypothetical protein